MSYTALAWLLMNLFFALCIFVSISDPQENILRITSPAKTFATSFDRLPTGVDIPCSIEASSLSNVSWYWNNTLLSSANSITRTVSSLNDVIILEETLNATQEGVYHCRTTVPQGSLRSPHYTVKIYDDPDFITPVPYATTHTVDLLVGWSVVLPCVKHLHSYFSLSWRFNGSLFTPHKGQFISSSGNLNIYLSRSNFTGSYRCTVVNRITLDDFTGPLIHLDVTAIPLPAHNNTSPVQASGVVYVDPGGRINLEYNRYYEPIYNISWGPNVTNQLGMAPKLNNISKSSNYTAVVFINKHQSRTVTIQVKVNSVPSVRMNVSTRHYICPGESPTLSCTVSNSLPPPTPITWFHNADPVAVGDTLTLTHSSTQLGFYQCYVENSNGASYDYTLLDTFPTPRIGIKEHTPLLLTYGSPLSLTCYEITNTSATQTSFNWRRGVLELSESSILFLPYMTSDMAGDYTCTAYACPPHNVSVSVTVNVSDPELRITQLHNAPHSVSTTWPPHPTARQHVLESRVGDSQIWSVVANTSQLFYTPRHLQLAIEYTFRVSYFREAERIQISTSFTFELDPAPTIFFVIPLSPTQLLLRWMWDGELASLDYFIIRYESTGGGTSNQTVLISQLDKSASYFERAISDLKPNSEYNVVVFGVKTAQNVWNTPYSSAKMVLIPPYKLTTFPPNLTVSHPSNSSLYISYSQLSNISAEYGEILGYKILVYIEDNPFNGIFHIQSPHETSLNLTLSPGVEYYSIHVLAFTIAGDGPETGQSLFLPNSSRINSTAITATTRATTAAVTTASSRISSSIATTLRVTNTSTASTVITATTQSHTVLRMITPPTNTTRNDAQFLPYLPYIVALPAAFCLTCAVILIVLVGKCFHMRYWRSVRDEADDYRMRRYEAHISNSKKRTNNNNSNVKLQSVIKSASPTHPHPFRTDIALEPRRMRTYQVPLIDGETAQLNGSNDSLSSSPDHTSGRPPTPDSGKVLDTFSDEVGSGSAVSPQHEKGKSLFSFETNLDSSVPSRTGTSSVQNKSSKSDGSLSHRIQEFSV